MWFFRRNAPAAAGRRDGRILAASARVRLREMERADVDAWVDWPCHSDPLFRTYDPPFLDFRQREIYYQQRRHAATSRQYSVDDAEGDLVGRISLRDLDWRVGSGVLGISFHPERLGQGLGTEALWAFLGYYFGPLRMRTLFLDVAAFNRRAFRVYEKCGFRVLRERWGDAEPDVAGVYVRPELSALRPLFRYDQEFVRPLVLDMVLRRDEWLRLREEFGGPTSMSP
jgi:diamine N-acetyltransferase